MALLDCGRPRPAFGLHKPAIDAHKALRIRRSVFKVKRKEAEILAGTCR
jgi:hypothetical protein